MYPFFVFDLPEDTDDAAVAERYRQLVAAFPPDRAPEAFDAVRQAWEGLRDARARVATRLFYFDLTGESLAQALPRWMARGARARASADVVRGLLAPDPAHADE
jgi:hypothetical protein